MFLIKEVRLAGHSLHLPGLYMDLWRRTNNTTQSKHPFSFPLMPDKKYLLTDFFNITGDEAGPVAGQKTRAFFGFYFFSPLQK